MEKLIKTIREKIKQRSNPKAYAEEIGIRTSTMYNFLNQKAGVNVNTFFKIIEPLGLKVINEGTMIKVQSVWIGKTKYQVGDFYESKEVLFCFGDASSSVQYMLLKSEKEEKELVVC